MKNSVVKKLIQLKNFCWILAIILFTVACESSVSFSEEGNSGEIMFGNASTYLAGMLAETANGKPAYVLIDDTHPGISVDSITGDKIAAPQFLSGANSNIYYPSLGSGASGNDWIRYMQLEVGKHRFRLLDTLQTTLLDTTFILNTERPQSIFFADSVMKFSAVAIEHENVVTPDKARIKLLNLFPDVDGGGVAVTVALQEALTDSLAYLQETPYKEYNVPEDGRLYLNIYSKEDETTPFMQNSITVQPGHNYLVILRGYTKRVFQFSPETGLININADPYLDVINVK